MSQNSLPLRPEGPPDDGDPNGNAIPPSWLTTAPARPVPAGLHLVAVPIGALRDITLRALDTLAAADLIACEDTRVTGRLLTAYGLRKPLQAYHDHNAAKVRPALLARLERGETIAFVSDAGTPMVSDPGYRLVADAIAAGLPVTSAPGASAALPALQLSALPSDRFSFLGFLPSKAGDRTRLLQQYLDVPGSLILYEAAPRLAATLAMLSETLGDRPAAVVRELTKLHEEVRRDSLSALAQHYQEAGPPKGEIVIVTGPPAGTETLPTPEEIDQALRSALENQSVKEAAALVAEMTGLKKRDLYQRAVQLKDAE